MIIIVEVHDNDRKACKNIEHFEQNFDDTVFRDNGHQIRVVYKRDSNKNCYRVIAPNGDNREVESLRLDKLVPLLMTLTGIKVKSYE